MNQTQGNTKTRRNAGGGGITQTEMNTQWKDSCKQIEEEVLENCGVDGKRGVLKGRRDEPQCLMKHLTTSMWRKEECVIEEKEREMLEQVGQFVQSAQADVEN